MSKLVAYFSASGNTASLARKLAEAAGADLHEIRPAVPYTREDLDWMNKQSRSSIEMSDKTSRPVLAEEKLDISDYDTIYVGFPVWWTLLPPLSTASLRARTSPARGSFFSPHPAEAALERL